jgi:hypothetical protein
MSANIYERIYAEHPIYKLLSGLVAKEMKFRIKIKVE